MHIRREFDTTEINRILNDPAVLPFVTIPGLDHLDASPLVSDHNNVLLMTDGGGIIFHRDEPGIYEIHTSFLPGFRGRYVLDAARAMFRWMFTHTDCMILQTRVPVFNKAALWIAPKFGFSLSFERAKAWPTKDGLIAVKYYHFPYERWVLGEDDLIQSGRDFHAQLDREYKRHGRPPHEHEDEECHDRFAGAWLETTLGSQPEKGTVLYNRWARLAGYGQIVLLSQNPAVVDIAEAVLLIEGGSFKVIKCQGQKRENGGNK